MALQISTKHSKKVKTQQKKKVNLGTAPNAIYDLDREISEIKKQETTAHAIHECDNILQAKQALYAGQEIKYNFPKDITALGIVNKAESLGLPTLKIKKVLGSSMVIKNMIDGFVQKSQQNNYNGYLKQCKEVTALQCNDKLVSQVRIKLDMDYDKFVTQDHQFKNKFINELSHNVFKCSNDAIDIVQVKEGSLLVTIGVPILALVAAGLIVISICVNCYRRARNSNGTAAANINGNNHAIANNVQLQQLLSAREVVTEEKQEFYPRQRVRVNKAKQGRPYFGTVKGFEYGDNETDGDKVIIKYDDDVPSDTGSTETFSLTDRSLFGLEPGQDPTIEASIHITQKAACIMARKNGVYNV